MVWRDGFYRVLVIKTRNLFLRTCRVPVVKYRCSTRSLNILSFLKKIIMVRKEWCHCLAEMIWRSVCFNITFLNICWGQSPLTSRIKLTDVCQDSLHDDPIIHHLVSVFRLVKNLPQMCEYISVLFKNVFWNTCTESRMCHSCCRHPWGTPWPQLTVTTFSRVVNRKLWEIKVAGDISRFCICSWRPGWGT